MDASEWRKGASLSDKTARRQYGLTQDQVLEAIEAGKLQYRLQAMHRNPFLRLLRREVEGLVKKTHGGRHLKEQQAMTELAQIGRELRQLRARVAELEERKAELAVDLGR